MLAQIALVVFAMCGMLAIIVDVGYARLSQGQMQSAADTAALEALRKSSLGETARRTSANRLVQLTFDDDLDPTNGDPEYQFGAGPVMAVGDGVGNLHAMQTVTLPDPPVYKPDLQLNQQNAVHGDMVSGRFCYRDDPGPSEDASFAEPNATVCFQPQRGSGPYARNDFNPAVSAVPANNTAFLVRLRRSNEFQESGGVDPDVASSGPALPLTFGKATMIAGDDPASPYSVRRDGLTVRATAIAAARPVLRVGVAQPQANPPLPGVTLFALRDTFVSTLNVAGAQVTINPTTGVICSGAIPPAIIATCTATAANAVGRFVANRTTIDTVGRPLPGPVPIACAAQNATGYGPVFSPMTLAPGVTRIIGFAGVGLRQDVATPARAADPCAKVITRAPSAVAPANATATLPTGLPVAVPAAQLTEVLCRNNPPNPVNPLTPLNPACSVLVRVNYSPLLAPVLAR